MNPIAKALDEIKFELPVEILNYVFFTQDALTHCGGILNVDTRIREAVIEARVMVDLDLIGGTEAFIDLQLPVRTEAVDPYTMVYYIPDEMTQNRPIVQAYSIHFGILGYTNAASALTYQDSALGSATRRLLDSATKVPAAATSYMNILAHNVIMTRYVYMPYSAAFMRCRLGNDSEMSWLRPTAIPAFAELCVLAIKAYIYIKTVVPMGQAVLSGGQALGVFQETINEWREANQQYKEALKRFKVVMLYNDPEAKRRYLRTLVGAP